MADQNPLDRFDIMIQATRHYLDTARCEFQTGPDSAPDSIGTLIDAVISLAGAVDLLKQQAEAGKHPHGECGQCHGERAENARLRAAVK